MQRDKEGEREVLGRCWGGAGEESGVCGLGSRSIVVVGGRVVKRERGSESQAALSVGSEDGRWWEEQQKNCYVAVLLFVAGG